MIKCKVYYSMMRIMVKKNATISSLNNIAIAS